MKHPRKSISNRGFQLKSEAAAFLNRNYPRPYRFTSEGAAEVEQQSHRQLVDETIDEYEAENHDS